MNVNLVVFGKVGSGKTVLSHGLAAALGARWSGFGFTIKGIAAELGIPQTREQLQTLGAKLVADDPEALCRRVIQEGEPQDKQCMVIDGLRHKSIHDTLSAMSKPRRLLCIFVAVPDDIRYERLQKRDHISVETIQELEAHSTEAQVAGELLQLADYIADNSGDLETTLRRILGWIQTEKNKW